MTEEEKQLLITYMCGFNDELDSMPEKWAPDWLLKAYQLGRQDARVGDDVTSVDYQTDEQILERIRS